MDAGSKRTISAEQAELLRQIPSIDELLAQPRLAALFRRVDRNLVVEESAASLDRKSTRLNSSHLVISYAVFCLKKKNKDERPTPPVTRRQAQSASRVCPP